MRAIIQRVKEPSVSVDGKCVGRIEAGLLIYLGVSKNDTEKDIKYIAEKAVRLRIFPDSNGQMNLSALDLQKELLLVSQFTLYGDCRKGRRPSFNQSASGEDAKKLYENAIQELKSYNLKVETGQFQAHMSVQSENDGPVTMMIDSEKIF